MIIPSEAFIYISIFIVVLYLVFMIIGYTKGFLYELMSLGYTALSVIIAWAISPTLANLYPIVNLENISDNNLLLKTININPIINTVIYFIIVFLLLKLFYIVLSLILKGMNKIPVVGKLNQILGLFAGIFNATIVTLALTMLLSLPIIKNGKEVKENTILMFINKYSVDALNLVVENINFDKLKDSFEGFKIEDVRTTFQKWIESNNE